MTGKMSDSLSSSASLVDNFARRHTYLRISVTDRCNLRCRYCRPHEDSAYRPNDALLTFDEIIRVATVFTKMGVSKVRLTGGEPLVRKDLPLLVERLVRLSGIQTVGMTTNGVLLKQYAADLKHAGLHALNISLDTLRPERFFAMARRDEFDRVFEAILTVLDLGFSPLKLNVVVIKGVNDDELLDFVHLAKDRPFNIRFIEYMPFNSNRWSEAGFISYGEMHRVISDIHEMVPVSHADAHAVSKDFEIPGYKGTVSFISSMSEHFCGACNRIRLTAEGAVKPCLFSPAETNLRSILRESGSDGELEEAIRTAVEGKWISHPPVDILRGMINRSMIRIGG
jgi:molybdenum cofactor biosynthesis protein A